MKDEYYFLDYKGKLREYHKMKKILWDNRKSDADYHKEIVELLRRLGI